MASTKEDLIKQLLEELTEALKSKLPLEHFSQFYDDPHFDNLAQIEAKKVLGNFQASSKLNMQETFAVANELFPKLQDVINEWKAKNGENKSQCDLFLQSQVDFLVCDFRTSVMIKLIAAPDGGIEDLETFMKCKKLALIDIFEKLSKPGEPQSSADMKTKLVENLECVKMETLEKQKHYLERKTTEEAQKVLEDSKVAIMKIATRLKSELNAYNGNDLKDLVKAKLIEISCFMSIEGKLLEKYHPNIYSAVLRTTAEVRKCLDDKEFEDMGADELAETLHEQLLFDFAGENHAVRSSCENLDLDSMSSENEARRRNGISPEKEEIQQCQQNEVHIDFSEEEEMKEEIEDEDDMDLDLSGMDEKDCDNNDGENREEDDEGNEENASKMSSSPVYNSSSSNSNRRSARLQKSNNPVGAKHSKQKCRDTVAETEEVEDEIFERSDEPSTTDDNDEDDPDYSSSEAHEHEHKRFISKPSGRKLHRPKKRPLNDDRYKPNPDKITYLHLKGGRPTYRCNVCNRKCFQNMVQYHGEHCGKKEMPYTCDECGMGFLKKQYLQEHERIHTGQRPYECPECSNGFTQPSNLRRHMRSHNRTRFACKVCKLRFISGKCLQGHNRSMHKEKFPFACMYCNERFDLMYKLRTHVISHADVRPFRCPTCDTSSNSKPTLVKHLELGHSQPRHIAQKVADDAAVAFLVEETKDESYFDTPKNKIHTLLVSHIIKKANLKLPKGSSTHS